MKKDRKRLHLVRKPSIIYGHRGFVLGNTNTSSSRRREKSGLINNANKCCWVWEYFGFSQGVRQPSFVCWSEEDCGQPSFGETKDLTAFWRLTLAQHSQTCRNQNQCFGVFVCACFEFLTCREHGWSDNRMWPAHLQHIAIGREFSAAAPVRQRLFGSSAKWNRNWYFRVAFLWTFSQQVFSSLPSMRSQCFPRWGSIPSKGHSRWFFSRVESGQLCQIWTFHLVLLERLLFHSLLFSPNSKGSFSLNYCLSVCRLVPD